MRRLHLFEFEDLPLLPRALRDATTLYLETVERVFGVHRLFAPKLAEALSSTGERRLLDMGSGGGGPIRHVVAEVERTLGAPVHVTLSDLRPNERAARVLEAQGDGRLRYLREPVDASNPPPALPGVRSMFAFFHHLPPAAARETLARAYRGREAICIFEITDPTPAGLLGCLLMPLYVLLFTPLVRPLTVSQLLLTYLLPVLPLLIAWDGLVSTLRTYDPEQLRRMTRDLQDEGYRWEIGRMRHPTLPITFPYAVGAPCPG
ncbi:MAG: hypothetical protein PVI30_15665 [Myxococcales bacterium]|jgi:hypothetical protein